MATALPKATGRTARHDSDTVSEPWGDYTPESNRRERSRRRSSSAHSFNRSRSQDASPCSATHTPPASGLTSTPLHSGSGCRPRVPSSSSGVIILEETSIHAVGATDMSPSTSDIEKALSTSLTARSSISTPLTQVAAPIVGYEIMEERARFTVFKIHVSRGEEDWFIFRRYTDFVRLNDKLRECFPHFRLSLPPKKWFGDNFDRSFLDDRMLGLQAFLNNVTSHRDVADSDPVRQFFCYDEPPGAHDSLEESKALCETLEDKIYQLRRELQERDARIMLLQEEVSLHKAEVQNLRKSLKIERALNAKNKRSSPTSVSMTSQRSSTSVLQDQASYTEADQAHMDKASSSCVEEEEPSDVFESASVSSVDDVLEDLNDMKLSPDAVINTDPNANCHLAPDLANTKALIANLNCRHSEGIIPIIVHPDNSTELEWDDDEPTNISAPSNYEVDSRKGSSVLSVV